MPMESNVSLNCSSFQTIYMLESSVNKKEKEKGGKEKANTDKVHKSTKKTADTDLLKY
jgi:hypothetical protein